MLKNKDVNILTLILLQDVTTFSLNRFDLAADLESIFIEAAETCLCFSTACRNSCSTDTLKGRKYLTLQRMDWFSLSILFKKKSL